MKVHTVYGAQHAGVAPDVLHPQRLYLQQGHGGLQGRLQCMGRR
jgi:hypothetical protein